jgi:hypothetical protein
LRERLAKQRVIGLKKKISITEAVRLNNGKNWKKIAENLDDRTDV